MRSRRWRAYGWGLAAAVGALLAAGVVWRLRLPPTVLSAGEYARYDDFGFTALAANECATYARAKASGQGRSLYVVLVDVRNDAKRVAFDFQPGTVKATAGGCPLSRLPWDSDQDLEIPHGVSRTFPVVFEGPSNLSRLDVSFGFGGAIGDVLDAVLVGRFRIPVIVDRNIEGSS